MLVCMYRASLYINTLCPISVSSIHNSSVLLFVHLFHSSNFDTKMCRGREEEERKQDYLSEDECLTDEECVCKDDHHHHGSQFSPSSSVSCELCDSEASVYCQADDAFLCEQCDTRVHAANFLAQRHIRCFLCTNCHSLTHRYLIGLSVQVLLPTILCKTEITANQSNDESDVEEPNCSNQLIRPFLFL